MPKANEQVGDYTLVRRIGRGSFGQVWLAEDRTGLVVTQVAIKFIEDYEVNYNGNYPYANAPKGEYRQKTIEVGSLGVANAFGLYDMHGNVWEWCQDPWHDSYKDAPTDGSVWEVGADNSRRVVRGGSWYYISSYCRAAYRTWVAPGDLNLSFGLRVVARTLR